MVPEEVMNDFWFLFFDGKKPISELISFLAGHASFHDAITEATQIFDQHYSQSDGNCPKLPDCQGLHLLIGENKSLEHFWIAEAISMSNECPRYAPHPPGAH